MTNAVHDHTELLHRVLEEQFEAYPTSRSHETPPQLRRHITLGRSSVMYRKRHIALALGVGAAVVLVGTLYLTLGLVDALGVVAVAAVVIGLYRVRHSARRALLHDRRSMRHRRAHPPSAAPAGGAPPTKRFSSSSVG